MPGLVTAAEPPKPLLAAMPEESNSQIQIQREEIESTKSPIPKKTPSPSTSRARPSPDRSLTAKKKSSPSEKPKLDESALDNPDLGPFLLKLARDAIASCDSPSKALDYAIRASKSFERCGEEDGEPRSLELTMSLHVIAAIYCSLGKFEEAVPVLEQAVRVPEVERGADHALAEFSGYMQLGDTHSMLGRVDQSIACYSEGLRIQMQALGDDDPRVAETCRYLAEANVEAMRFDEAEKLCQKTLELHREHSSPGSIEEAADRRLMALICDAKDDYEASLEHLVLASMAMIANGQDSEVAAIDIGIGNTYLNLGRFDEAVFSYQKALTVLKSTKGDNHPLIATVFVRLADLYFKTGKLRESKSYCENALRIYSKPVPGTSPEEIAGGLTEISAIYESMNEPEEALKLLQKAMMLLGGSPGQWSTVAGIEAQLGVVYYMVGRYEDARSSFENVVSKLRASGERKSAFLGFVLNQMGLVYGEAAALYEEAREILEQECGSSHQDTLGVYSNLAATYDAMGRMEDAIQILDHILKVREEELGTANPDVDDEKKRLSELLKEAGRASNRKQKSLENLLDSNSRRVKKDTKRWPSLGFRN